MRKKICVIGSGFAGLSAAAILASKGLDVHLYEKNDTIGGRARVFKSDGFTFDMGPSWYWMPEVFENFYQRFGHSTKDFYELKRLSPSYSIIFPEQVSIRIPDNFDELCGLFESIETGAAHKLRKFTSDAQKKYDAAMGGLILKPGNSIFEYMDLSTIRQAIGMNLFSSFSSHARKYFKSPYLISILQFPILFLGSTPAKIPALYSLMNYAAFKLGTWYPMGGFGKMIDAFSSIAQEKGVVFHLSEPVQKLNIRDAKINSITTHKGETSFDAVIGAGDYNHIEQKLIDSQYRQYSAEYWDKREMAPSALLFYVGVNKKIPKLCHHNLFFDADFNAHANEIYVTKKWPANPLFYVCCPSITDPSVAPSGMENLFILMPLAPGVSDDENIREKYFDMLLTRLEKYAGEEIRSHVVYKKSYCVSDFVNDYNAYKGNAYGLANTLAQTAILKPKIASNKIKNLYYAGQLTVPGPGVPPSIISGEIASAMLIKNMNS